MNTKNILILSFLTCVSALCSGSNNKEQPARTQNGERFMRGCMLNEYHGPEIEEEEVVVITEKKRKTSIEPQLSLVKECSSSESKENMSPNKSIKRQEIVDCACCFRHNKILPQGN